MSIGKNTAEVTSVVYAGMDTRDGTVLGRQLFPVYEPETAWQQRVENDGLAPAECDVSARKGTPIPDGTGQGLLASSSWELVTAEGTDDEESIVLPLPYLDVHNPADRYRELAHQTETWLGRGGMTIVVCESTSSYFRYMAGAEGVA